jgi:acyl-coenzyme A thioesterase PaaI-like protein
VSETDRLREMLLNPEMCARLGSAATAHAGIDVIEATREQVRMKLNYADELRRDAISGALHAGAIVTAMDSAMGFALMLRLDSPQAIATLELRYDEIHVPGARADVIVAARCEGIEDEVAYLTGDVWAGDRLIGHATARFIVTGTPGGLSMLAHMENRLSGAPS